MNHDDLRTAARQALKFCEDLQGCYWGDLETVVEDLRAALGVTEKATMNRDDIIRMAKESGHGVQLDDRGPWGWMWNTNLKMMTDFAALVAAAEREACAKVCEETTAAWTQHLYNEGCVDCAKSIRARGEE